MPAVVVVVSFAIIIITVLVPEKKGNEKNRDAIARQEIINHH